MTASNDRNSSQEGAGESLGQFVSSPCYLHEFEDFDAADSIPPKEQKNQVLVKRIYEAPSGGDCRRFLVDRLWPRGISREKANLDAW